MEISGQLFKKIHDRILALPAMLYLVTGEWIDDPTVSADEFPAIWDKMVV